MTHPWAHRLALVTSGATLVLIVAGGLVTNTGAALAVPDWPTTFGHNLFLFPWSGMVGGVLVEHGHRLLGATVGLLTLSLAVTVWLTERRGWLRGLVAVAVGLVCLQGALGGLRVVLLRDALAIVHGCVAPLFFALTVVLASVTSGGFGAAPAPLAPRDGRALGPWAAAVAGLLYGQIVLGALTTHAGWVNLHLVGAVVAVGGATALAWRVLTGHGSVAALGWRARTLAWLTALQVALGLGAYVARFTGLGLPAGEVAVIGLPVAHRAVGAALLGLTATLALEAWRRRPLGALPDRAGAAADLLDRRAERRVTA